MSRIDEALRQAGLRSEPNLPSSQAPAGLESFPIGPDAEPEAPVRLPERLTAAPPASARQPEPQPRPVAPPPPQAVQDLSAERSRTMKVPAAEKLVVHDKTGQACIEQYRRVAALLHQMQEERGTKVLMIASARPGEGKTLTAANLGLTLSESYRRRVLLIDADLRRPSLNTLFKVRSMTGLSERLKGNGHGPLRVLELSDSLALLPGGVPDTDPMAGLTSGKMPQIIEQAGASYDWVILDTPPLALQPDASLLAGMVEAVVFVIAAGLTPSSIIQHSIETVGREKIVGIILNRIDNSDLDEAAYYSYYYNRDPVRAREKPTPHL